MFNPQCPKCNYSLVLLSNRGKYKCALCSGLFPQKEIDDKEFRKWNKMQKEIDIENYKIERKMEIMQNIAIKNDIRRLFIGSKFPSRKKYNQTYYLKNREKIRFWQKKSYLKHKDSYAQRKADYYKQNKEIFSLRRKEWYLKNKEQAIEIKTKYYENHKAEVLLKAKLRRMQMRDILNQRQSELRKQNSEWTKSKESVRIYRRKMKQFALQCLENEDYKPYLNDLTDSVSTFALSYLLNP